TPPTGGGLPSPPLGRRENRAGAKGRGRMEMAGAGQRSDGCGTVYEGVVRGLGGSGGGARDRGASGLTRPPLRTASARLVLPLILLPGVLVVLRLTTGGMALVTQTEPDYSPRLGANIARNVVL